MSTDTGKVTGVQMVETALVELEAIMTGPEAAAHFIKLGEDPTIAQDSVKACRTYFDADGTEKLKSERFATMMTFMTDLVARNRSLAEQFQAGYELSLQKLAIEKFQKVLESLKAPGPTGPPPSISV